MHPLLIVIPIPPSTHHQRQYRKTSFRLPLTPSSMTPLPQQPVKAGQQGDSGPVLSLKPPRQPFSATVQTGCQATFLHPGYDDGHNILLILPALDSSGIHHETARIACAILADSRWDGFLSYEKDGPRLEQGPDSILPCRRYYFCIEGGMSGSSYEFSHSSDAHIIIHHNRRPVSNCSLIQPLSLPARTPRIMVTASRPDQNESR
jgi:hypothetical protein